MKLPVPKGGWSKLWTVVSMLAVVCLCPIYSLAQSPIAFSADFETSNIRSGWDWMEACCSHSLTQSFEQKRTGNSSLRVELRKSDGTQGGSKRAELSENNHPWPNNPNYRYYAFSHYLPEDFKVDSVQEILFQWHLKATSGITLGASPPLSLMIHKGNWELGIIYDSTDINIYKGKNYVSKNYTLGPWEKGKWTDWVIRYEYSYEDDGLIQVWKNQKLIFEHKGKNFYKGSYPPYFKMGLYKWSWSDSHPKTSKQSVLTSRVLYVDNVRVGTKDAKASDFFIDPVNENRPPTAKVLTSNSIQLPANSVKLDGSNSSDADGKIVKYQWAQVSGPSTATLSNATTSAATASGLVAGTYQFRLTVTDDQGATASATTSVVVAAAPVANKAPVSKISTSTSIQLPANSIKLDGTGSTDADGKIAKYQWSQVSGPSTASLTNATTSVATAGSLVAGTYQFRLTVTDDKGAAASSTTTVTVAAAAVANKAPVSKISTTTSIQLPTNSVKLDGTGSSDADGKIAKYQWSQVSGPSTASLTNATTSAATAGSLVAGTYQFRLTVTDDKGATASATTAVAVAAAPIANKAPVSKISTTTSIQLPANSVKLDGTGSSDADGKIVKYQWTQVTGPSTANLANATTSVATAGSLIAGTYQFRLIVTDDKGATASSTIYVAVAAAPVVNKKPVANAGSNKSYQVTTTSFTLDGSGSTDSDGKIAAYSWRQLSGPNTSVLATPTAVKTSVSKFAEGSYKYILTVTDDDGAKAADTVTISIIPAAVGVPSNQAPKALTDGNKQIRLPNNTVQVDGSKSTDADGRIASYQWSQVSGPSTATIASPKTAGTAIQNLKAGTYTFQLKVTDNGGLSATANLTVTVLAAYRGPVANAGADQTLRLPVSTASLNGSASTDPNGQSLTYSWKQISGPNASSIASAGAATTSVSGLLAGTYQYTLTVKNTANLQAVDTVKLVVLAQVENQAPVANVKDSMLSNSPWRWQLSSAGSYDKDGRISTYSWSYVSGPVTPILSTPGQAATEVTNLIKGTYKFKLTITDNQGKSSVKEHSIVVGDTSSESSKYDNLSVRFWPNPVSDVLRLRVSGKDEGYTLIRIFDTNGSKVAEQVSSKYGQVLQVNIPVQRLRGGVYFLFVKVGNKPPVVKKFMKK